MTVAMGGVAAADEAKFDIPAQPLAAALTAFSQQSRHAVLYKPDLAAAKASQGVSGSTDTDAALTQVLAGTGLNYRHEGGTYLIVAEDQDSGNVVQELVVTAQKKEEAIQTVPIAISAFTQKSLEEQHIEGGFDLLKAVPNVTFSKNNFSGYNFSIRGIGTKAVSATTDPGVAVSFNNTTLIRNRLFEQEYFDVERVEVLRGPQGTLYGRNATAGVINVISAKPTGEFAGQIKAEVGNYDARRASGFINVPIFGEKLAVRLAGSFTRRSGYGFNAVTGKDVDGRDLWSGRLTVGFHPIEKLHGEFVWEHFNENDNRARTSKQLCHRDPGPATIPGVGPIAQVASDFMSQGCVAGSLYDDGAFGTPNGSSLPYIWFFKGTPLVTPEGNLVDAIPTFADPYASQTQTHNLREISSKLDPIYRAKADIFEFNLAFDLTPSLTLSSQTAYNRDQVYSTQDFNRFNTAPIFASTIFAPGGYFPDPQLGTSNTIALQDIAQESSRQFSQEFRLQSQFAGNLNFSAGLGYTTFHDVADYYVLGNVLTYLAIENVVSGTTDPTQPWTYIDPHPLSEIDGQGENYFRSKNPYKLTSKAVFGELYWQASDAVKVTAGLRYTDDKKAFELWPTVLLDAGSKATEDAPGSEYFHHDSDINQQWRKFTGRLGIDWRPQLAFTDQTMLYAFYSRGYKAGGANPPNMAPITLGILNRPLALPPNALHPATFDPEYVNAFELGSKNTLLGGSLVLNGDVFFYDYKNYQVSQIIDRLALNENFDSKVWGAELESVWQPARNLRINMSLGYLDTSIAKGESSIDVMNRTQGNPDWVVLKNWLQYPSNCIVPRSFVSQVITWARANFGDPNNPFTDRNLLFTFFDSPCEGMFAPGHLVPFGFDVSAITGIVYDPYDQVANPGTNNGQGFSADLSHHELPNSPHWTQTIGAQYSWELREGWQATLRGDFYHQSQSFARVYNTEYDKLHGWYNANLSLVITKPDIGLQIELYAKNVLDKDPITDAFLNSDDTGLTTNVFVLDPRLIGFSVTKKF